MASKGNSKKIWLLMGIVILIPIILLFIARSTYSNKSLTALHKDKLGISESDISRGAGDGDADPFEEGMAALTDKKYAEAVTFFEAVTADSDTYAEAKLYLSYAQFEKEDFDSAVESAQIVIENSESLVNIQAAEWLQIQAMLASDKTDDATFDKLLDKIAQNEQHMLQAEASELDKSLNSFWRGLVF